MPTSAPVNSFDYTALDLDTASFVRQQTGEIRALMRRATQDIFEIGQKLIEIKQKLGHGNFLNWLEAEFSWTERTARRFMSVAEQFAGKSDTMTELNFAPTALYTLASPSLSSEARDEAIERAKAGEFISAKKAAEIKQKYPSKTAKTQKKSKITEKLSAVETSVEILDAELEEGRGQRAEGIRINSSVAPSHQSHSDTDKPTLLPTASCPLPSKALPPSPQKSWWRLSGFEQNHLLFGGAPEDPEFLSRLPERLGVWLSCPPSPSQWVAPPAQWLDSSKKWLGTTIHLSTNYSGINLKVIRQTIEAFLTELSSEGDDAAMLAYLSDWSFLALLDDLKMNCYIAEPSASQCQVIIKAWQDSQGKVEKLETLDGGGCSKRARQPT